MPRPPAAEYQARLEARRAEHARLAARDARFAYARLGAFVAAVALLVLAYQDLLSYWAVLAPAAVFALLLTPHDRVIRARDTAGRAADFYERGLARLEDRWAGGGETGERFRDPHHLYADDLDLFGSGSLFELLSIARTGAGEATLAAWLKQGADPGEVAARQAAVSELAPALDLREAVAIAGSDARAGVQVEPLLAWAEAPVAPTPAWVRAGAALLAAATVAAIVSWFVTGAAGPMLALIAVEALVVVRQRPRLEHVLGRAGAAAHDLDVLADLLHHLESATFSAPRLQPVHDRLRAGGDPASHSIRALHRLVEMHDWEHNVFFRVISAVLMWSTQLAWAIESWRARHGRDVRGWLDAAGEFEALSSLAGYHYEHPDDPFPTILPAGGAGHFAGTALGHPLLPGARMVRNDVRLAGPALLVVSGSNMSGKSTLLRTTGINAVLALAGGPARAASLALSPLQIGATLRIQDSLQEGRSRFYAEITRLREIADAAKGPVPVLFLLDELFHGTNSHDRQVGAAGVLRGLLDRGAIGLITTHDLALTSIADALAPRATNVHFEDRFEGNEIRFDYRMKPGPVTRSNALALMRAVGLEVDA